MPATSKSSTKSPRDAATQGAAKPTGVTAKVDINTATIDQLKAIKGIGRSRAEEIVRYRGKQGPFASVDDIARVPHIGDMPVDELKAVKTQFVVRLADDQAPPTSPDQPKVDVNRANVEELRAVEGIGAERADEIITYREQMGGIRDLAELDALPHFRDEPEGQRGPIKARLKI
jgi:competence protein ComEA